MSRVVSNPNHRDLQVSGCLERIDFRSKVSLVRPTLRVVGTGVGFRMIGGLLTPEPSLKVYVNERAGGQIAPQGVAMPQKIGDLPVDVQEIGEVLPFSYARRFARPVPCGVSIGHPAVTAGTLGCLVALQNRKLCILSNNHVVANSNDARVGDACTQAGRLDGGRVPGDQIGILEDFVRISFPGPNKVDGGVVWTSRRFVKPEHVTYRLNPRPMAARLGMAVLKNGRTTQATIGSITDLSVRINVPYPGGVATFVDQVGVRGIGGVFSRGGDSGSVISTLGTKQPLALLFAGATDNSITFGNPIADVMEELSIDRFIDEL